MNTINFIFMEVLDQKKEKGEEVGFKLYDFELFADTYLQTNKLNYSRPSH